jgi:hypothetical protein
MIPDKKRIERIEWKESDGIAIAKFREHIAIVCESNIGSIFTVRKERQSVLVGEAGTMRRAQIECEKFIKRQYGQHHLFRTHNLAK